MMYVHWSVYINFSLITLQVIILLFENQGWIQQVACNKRLNHVRRKPCPTNIRLANVCPEAPDEHIVEKKNMAFMPFA
jgi:hypothetical protein